jgi:hypothetical protein
MVMVFLMVRQFQQAPRHNALGSLLETDLDHILERGGCNIPLTRQETEKTMSSCERRDRHSTRVSSLWKINKSAQVLETSRESGKLSNDGVHFGPRGLYDDRMGIAGLDIKVNILSSV